jgi:hypothetical protein
LPSSAWLGTLHRQWLQLGTAAISRRLWRRLLLPGRARSEQQAEARRSRRAALRPNHRRSDQAAPRPPVARGTCARVAGPCGRHPALPRSASNAANRGDHARRGSALAISLVEPDLTERQPARDEGSVQLNRSTVSGEVSLVGAHLDARAFGIAGRSVRSAPRETSGSSARLSARSSRSSGPTSDPSCDLPRSVRTPDASDSMPRARDGSGVLSSSHLAHPPPRPSPKNGSHFFAFAGRSRFLQIRECPSPDLDGPQDLDHIGGSGRVARGFLCVLKPSEPRVMRELVFLGSGGPAPRGWVSRPVERSQAPPFGRRAHQSSAGRLGARRLRQHEEVRIHAAPDGRRPS